MSKIIESTHILNDSHSYRESIRENVTKDKLQSSSTIIFSIANAMMGPSVLLLPLKFAQVGILTSIVVAFIIGVVSYRTCDLTHLHAKFDEIEYLTSIERILGKVWKYIYFVHSIVILWMAGIIYFLSLCDVTYSSLQLIFDQTWASESSITFGTFSYQYIGIIIMGMIGWLFFLPKLGKILDLTEKGIYSIAVESIFLIYLGFKSVASGSLEIVFYSDNTNEEVAFVTNESMTYTVGVFAMAFAIHNSIVAIVRKSRNPSKNSRDVSFAYIITFFVYCVTGFFGAMGLYTKVSLNPNTVLNNSLYDRNDTVTLVLLIITQLMTAFQLVTVLPVVNNITRTQLFIMIWGENRSPPKIAFILFNGVYILTYLVVQIWNISPNTVMSYGGAFIGFVITFLVPVGIHLKSVRAKQLLDNQGYVALSEGADTKKTPEIADFLRNKKSINYFMEYGVHSLIMLVGVYIFISQLLSLF